MKFNLRHLFVSQIPTPPLHFKKSLSYSFIITKSKMTRAWVQTCIFYLLLTAMLGLFLRWLIIYPIPGVSFRYMQHTHSHIAFMGWVFNAFFVAIILGYFKNELGILKSFHKLFIFLQISVMGMLVTFPFQGYGLFSIAFSSLHTILAFWFVIKFLIIPRNHNLKQYSSFKYLKVGFIFLAISALGPLALGFISVQGMKDSDWYELAIYFFLHFQYNGWFLFVVFALFFQTIEHLKLPFSKSQVKRVLIYFAIACIPAFSLSTLWTHPPSWVYATGAVSGIMQVVGLILFIYCLIPVWKQFRASLPMLTRILWTVAFISLVIKITLQALSAIPYLADMAYYNRNIVIAFLHLTFIGKTTLFLLGWLIKEKLLIGSSAVKLGLSLFIGGFLLTEFWLLVPWLLPKVEFLMLNYNQFMLGISSLLMLGVAIILFGNKSHTSTAIDHL